MLTFFIKSSIYFIAFFAFYKLVLAQFSFFKWNRAYLMMTPILAIVLPFAVFTIPEQATYTVVLDQLDRFTPVVTVPEIQSKSFFSLMDGIYLLWILGAFALFAMLVKAYYSIGLLKKRAQLLTHQPYALYSSQDIQEPFSFWKSMFIPDAILKNENARIIIEHEKQHLEQRHSLDILFIQLLKIVFWFQPMLYFYEKAIKNNHEHLVDSNIVRQISIREYGYILLGQLGLNPVPHQSPLVNTFFHSPLKQRIIMMTKNTNHRNKWFYLLILPLIAVFILFNCQKNQELIEDLTRSEIAVKTGMQNADYESRNYSGEIFQVVEQPPLFPGCEEIENKMERWECSQRAMLEYIYQNVKYPAIARKNNIEGQAVVTFVVETDGRISEARVLRDPGAGIGDAALAVVESMNINDKRWTPGHQNGYPVRVQYNIPIKFKL